jgi:MYXO-CTERM domain-containing protein
LLALCMSRPVRADQVVLADVSWSHPTDVASDSHYHIKPAAGTPANWKSPVDFTQGSVYFALDVKTKPAGDAPTKFQVCFEGSPSYACGDQSPTYTKVGHYTWMTSFTNFYQFSMVDWTKGVANLALIVKDDMNNKPAGDPKYVPTDLHVLIVMLSKGATYVPVTPSGGSGGSAAGSGGMNAAGAGGTGGAAGKAGAGGKAGSGGKPAANGGSGALVDAGLDAGTHTEVDASRPDASTSSAGTNGAAAGTSSAAGASPSGNAGSAATHKVMPKPGSNCSAAGGALGNAWFSALIAGLLLLRRRRS